MRACAGVMCVTYLVSLASAQWSNQDVSVRLVKDRNKLTESTGHVVHTEKAVPISGVWVYVTSSFSSGPPLQASVMCIAL